MTSISERTAELFQITFDDPTGLKTAELVEAYNAAADIVGDKHVNRFADRSAAIKRTQEMVAKAQKLADVPVATDDEVPAFLRKDAEKRAKPETAPEPKQEPEVDAQPEAQPVQPAVVEYTPKRKAAPSEARTAYWQSPAGLKHAAMLREFAAARRQEALERKAAAKAERKRQRDALKAAKKPAEKAPAKKPAAKKGK